MTVEPEDAAASAPARESVGGVVGVALGLALLAACVLGLLRASAQELDGAELIGRSFELGELPEGLAVGAAVRLPGGEEVVVLGRGAGEEVGALLAELDAPAEEAAQAAEEARAAARREVEGEARADAAEARPAAEPPPDAGASAAPGEGEQDEEGKAEEEEEKVDWSKVAPLATGTEPALVYLVHHPRGRAARAIDAAFRQVPWKDVREIGGQGGRMAVDGGRLPWGEYEADYVRERRFDPRHGFRDSVRVNLSLPGRCWIAYALWPAREEGSKEPVERLLGALRPREATEPGATPE